ncbi:class C sortase [Enterococcus sp. AZ196]|uniref:class C sortase n=1 Tax=Enterococcus sp. AZ196 TaxID=2774659 RepID=UPI003D2C8E47
MKNSEVTKINILPTLALILASLTSFGFFLNQNVESAVLKYKQEQLLKNIEYRPNSSVSEKNSINVSKAELGSPEAIIMIPSLKLKLPIYYGTSDKVLKYGIGITEGTGDVKGGLNKNPMLAGHNGLSKANLFNDLTKLEKGDNFILTVDNQNHNYRVVKIVEVELKTLKKNTERYLMPEPNKDLVTLMTCTPRYSNRNRYLVTGERTSFKTSDLKAPLKRDQDIKYLMMGFLPVVLAGAGLLIFRKKKGENRHEI